MAAPTESAMGRTRIKVTNPTTLATEWLTLNGGGGGGGTTGPTGNHTYFHPSTVEMLADTRIVVGDTVIITTTSQTWVYQGQGGLPSSDITAWYLTPGAGASLRYAVDVGDGIASAILVTHSLGVADPTVQAWDATTREHVNCGIRIVDLNTVEVTFASPPAAGGVRVVIAG